MADMPDQDTESPLPPAASVVARMLGRPAIAPLWISMAALFVDVAVLSLAFWFALYAASDPAGFAPIRAAGLAMGLALAGAFAMAASHGYAPAVLRDLPRALLRALLALALPVFAGVVFLPADPAAAFPQAAGIALVLAIVPLRAATAIAVSWLYASGIMQRRAVIAGSGVLAEQLIESLVGSRDSDVRIYGMFDARNDGRAPEQSLGVPNLGHYDDLIRFARQAEIDMVIIALPLEAEARVNWLLEKLRILPLEVHLSAFSEGFAFRNTRDNPLISALERSFAPQRRLAKRLFDLVFALAALVLLSPVMLAAALAVALSSPGPILFRQKRHGYNNRVIDVLKFRSMYHEDADPEARRVVTKGDARVTPVGRVLRKSSIDELPQLFNVLRGDLSLVGPRPHAVNARSSGEQSFHQIVDGYSARHRLPPGITGWAQINGWRGEIDAPEKLKARLEHDLYYIENWSLLLDLKILLRTPLSLLNTRNAY